MNYNFIANFDEAKIIHQIEDPQVKVQVWPGCICGGVAMDAIFAHPHALFGTAFEYEVCIPDPGIWELGFFTGIADKAKFPPHDSIKFQVFVNDRLVFDKIWSVKMWNYNQIKDIIIYPDDPPTIKFVTDDMGCNTFNWAVWGEPSLYVKEWI
ncbi:MAG: hypothetical protein A2W25_12240 [candidate division Zixibacteria bacterium RBG_16_53_22]|nr:MAG: hypothetical protein A2W25_12240 [candidate division Zixibacteria bacterium RBG_16_53_22]